MRLEAAVIKDIRRIDFGWGSRGLANGTLPTYRINQPYHQQAEIFKKNNAECRVSFSKIHRLLLCFQEGVRFVTFLDEVDLISCNVMTAIAHDHDLMFMLIKFQFLGGALVYRNCFKDSDKLHRFNNTRARERFNVHLKQCAN